MAKDDFDPVNQAMDAVGKMKPTKMVKTAASILPGSAKEIIGAGADVVETGLDGMDTEDMARAIADRLDMSVQKLGINSKLTATALTYHRNGEAALNTAIDIGTDLAAGFTGPIGFSAKMMFDYATYEEKPDPTGDLRKVYEFVAAPGEVSPEMVFNAIKAKVSPAERKKLEMFGNDGLGSDTAIKKHVGDLMGRDFVPGDETALEYLARKFNSGEYERAVIIMNKPQPIQPLEALDEQLAMEGEGYAEPNVVASGRSGQLAYSHVGEDGGMQEVGEADELPAQRLPRPPGKPRGFG